MKDEGYENILHAFMVRKFLTTPHNHSHHEREHNRQISQWHFTKNFNF